MTDKKKPIRVISLRSAVIILRHCSNHIEVDAVVEAANNIRKDIKSPDQEQLRILLGPEPPTNLSN